MCFFAVNDTHGIFGITLPWIIKMWSFLMLYICLNCSLVEIIIRLELKILSWKKCLETERNFHWITSVPPSVFVLSASCIFLEKFKLIYCFQIGVSNSWNLSLYEKSKHLASSWLFRPLDRVMFTIQNMSASCDLQLFFNP